MVDTVGNRLGPRATFVYQTDGGVSYNIVLDDSVSSAVGNPRSTQSLLPVLKASQTRPIQPRYYRVQLQSDPRVTKSIIVCNPDALNWVNSGATNITINGVTFVITARVGEKRFAPKVDPPPI